MTSTPLPTLDFSFGAPAFEWPLPPWAHRKLMASLPEGEAGAPAPCRLESHGGASIDGEMLAFEAAARQLRFRVAAGAPVELAFDRFRRLTLTVPWALAPRTQGAPLERVPIAAHERDYWIELAGGGHLAGRTIGHRQDDHGLFLFGPHRDGMALVRVFVPREACGRIAFGQSIEEAAAERWIATPEALVAAAEAQRHARILTVGDALVELGFVSHGIVEAMLRQQGPGRDAPLGEMLVSAGYLDRADLQTALAHKMGYPMVDLTRFPIDPAAARRLSHRSMVELRALPLMQHERRLYVAVDDLSAVPSLQGLQALASLEIVPVLAPRGRLTIALAALPQRLGLDVWASNVPSAVRRS